MRLTQTSRAVISARADVDTINSIDIIKPDILITLILIPFGNLSITNQSIESMTYSKENNLLPKIIGFPNEKSYLNESQATLFSNRIPLCLKQALNP